jgi:hypothetical protein
MNRQPSETVRCSICHDILNRLEHPELNAGTWSVCLDCWHKMQEYLAARGFAIVNALQFHNSQSSTSQTLSTACAEYLHKHPSTRDAVESAIDDRKSEKPWPAEAGERGEG